MSTSNIAQHAADLRSRVVREFAALKSIRSFDASIARGLKISGNRGYLCCVSELHAQDDVVIGQLARFRADVTTFPNQFRVTHEGTRRWLHKALLDVPDRILFLVLNRWGHVIGHLGFAHADNDRQSMELDNVIRGVKEVEPGLMSAATTTLIDWARATFSPREIVLRALEDNEHALRFYARLGFVPYLRQPLRRIESNGEINHVPLAADDDANADRYYVCMQLPLAKAA